MLVPASVVSCVSKRERERNVLVNVTEGDLVHCISGPGKTKRVLPSHKLISSFTEQIDKQPTVMPGRF